jgi:hypothetical protein
MATGYKVVRKVGDQLVSATRYCGRILEYTAQQETRPLEGDGPLAVFPTLSLAQQWIWDARFEFEIWWCAFTPSSEESLWYRTGHRRVRTGLKELPPGTRLAQSVTLTQKVSQNEETGREGEEVQPCA